jgi:hypothetical protein
VTDKNQVVRLLELISNSTIGTMTVGGAQLVL